MTDTEKYYNFPHAFVQELLNYLMLRPYGEVYPFLDKIRLEIEPAALATIQNSQGEQKSKDDEVVVIPDVHQIYAPGTK